VLLETHDLTYGNKSHKNSGITTKNFTRLNFCKTLIFNSY